jgi:hypothetical protein
MMSSRNGCAVLSEQIRAGRRERHEGSALGSTSQPLATSGGNSNGFRNTSHVPFYKDPHHHDDYDDRQQHQQPNPAHVPGCSLDAILQHEIFCGLLTIPDDQGGSHQAMSM